MELRARIRPLPRRAAFLAALVALFASALAGAVAPDAHAKKSKKAPVITGIAPKDVAVGEALTIRGRNFLTGRNKNTVVFKRKGARALFAKAEVGTRKMLRITVPAKLQSMFALQGGNPAPTTFRLRVLAKKFGKRFTSLKRSPLVSGPRPPKSVGSDADADCDEDGTKNRFDGDDDNDLLADDTEKAIGTDPCKVDTEGDGIEDGYEYQSAKDLNDDEHQDPNQVLPYPGKRPYPNPLFADADKDFDGDGLRLVDEQALWRYTFNVNKTAARTLNRLSYSDGLQYSLFNYENGDRGRRSPAQPSSTYPMQAQFLAWAGANGYGQVHVSGRHALAGTINGMYDIRDIDLSGVVEPAEVNPADQPGRGFGWVSDDERDEDADGLWNQIEVNGPLSSARYWAACYSMEGPFPIEYAGTKVDDADSDGDGVLDGADDQDHDDLPNVMETSRIRASHEDDREGGVICRVNAALLVPQDLDGDGKPDKQVLNHPDTYGRVNPFNPCLPFRDSRTCPRYTEIGTPFAPFDLSPDYVALQ